MQLIRKLKIFFAVLALFVLFWESILAHLLILLILFTISWRRQTELKNIRFWLIFLIISFLPSFFVPNHETINLSILIFLRSLILYTSLSLIADSISFNSFNRHLQRISTKKFATSLTLAFNLLPAIRKILVRSYSLFYFKPRRKRSRLKLLSGFATSILHQIIMAADNCAESMILVHRSTKPKLIIITGPKHTGKTSYLTNLTANFKNLSWPVSGIISPGTMKNGKRNTISVINLKTGEKKILASRTKPIKDAATRHCSFKFDRKGFEFANKALLDYSPSGIVFLDEFGPLEFLGKGYCHAFNHLLHSNISALYVVVRKELLSRFIAEYAKVPYEIVEIDSGDN